MQLDLLLKAETAVVVSLSVIILVGISRAIHGGALVDPDKSVRDGIAGVVIYSISLLWYCSIFAPGNLATWANQPLGVLAMSMAMIGIVLTRLQTLWKSCRNRI